MYNLTQFGSATNIYELLVYANNSSAQFLVLGFVLAIFFITLMALKRYEFDSALLVSSIVSFLISLLLAYGKLINLYYSLIFLLLAALVALYMMVAKGD